MSSNLANLATLRAAPVTTTYERNEAATGEERRRRNLDSAFALLDVKAELRQQRKREERRGENSETSTQGWQLGSFFFLKQDLTFLFKFLTEN